MPITTQVGRDLLIDCVKACSSQLIQITVHESGAMTFDRFDDLASRLTKKGLPITDPHGIPWCELSEVELRERAGWCMRPAHHDALSLVRRIREEI
jgi:hypothetical protein